MSFFRVNIYLPLFLFIKSFFLNERNIEKKVEKILKTQSQKKYFILTSQLRSGFILLLEYLKKKTQPKMKL